MIAIIDYGMGNLRSVLKCLERLNVDAFVSSKPTDIEKADKLILPGVGHFGKAMDNLGKQGLTKPLHEKIVGNQTPILGICLGVQLFARGSEEGGVEGLGWIDAQVVRLDQTQMDMPRKIPHMGWNTLQVKRDCSILRGIGEEDIFYFGHSFHVSANNKNDVVANTEYGYEFASAIHRGSLYGVQFHPEKSHSQGMAILRRFARLNGGMKNKDV